MGGTADKIAAMAEQNDGAGQEDDRRFRRIAGAGISFQGGSAAVDSATIIAAFVFTLTSSSVAVGAASAALRFGWVFPQIFVGYLAQRSERRMPFYKIGAFGRASCLAVLALAIITLGGSSAPALTAVFFVLWVGYSCISGVVAVPYNDIVGRSIPSERRSRLLAWRFFGGGLLGIAVAAAAHRLLTEMAFPYGHAALFGLGAVLMFVSSGFFVSAGEPGAATIGEDTIGEDRPRFPEFLRRGAAVYREDRRFRLFLYSQWLGGAALMVLPFYVIQARVGGLAVADVALLLAAQTVGALVSNALWGHWGDKYGKQSLLEGVAILRMIPPVAILALAAVTVPPDLTPWVFCAVFVFLGALMNGTTIAMLGYLMEISPDNRRPAYSGYFNVLVSPASLLPIAGGLIVSLVSLHSIFAIAAAAAVLQFLAVRRLRRDTATAP